MWMTLLNPHNKHRGRGGSIPSSQVSNPNIGNNRYVLALVHICWIMKLTRFHCGRLPAQHCQALHENSPLCDLVRRFPLPTV